MTAPQAVDNADWLKTAAIGMVVVGHIGYFFIEEAEWWSVFGRMAAPIFFFLMGYARSRTIPLKWLWLGLFLTLLDSWNTDWEWVAPNILFSLALIRALRPYVLTVLQRYSWIAFALMIAALLAVLPVAANIVDYGAEGWLWALVGLCQRMYVDQTEHNPGMKNQLSRRTWQKMRLVACSVAAPIYIWQEQLEFLFSQAQLAVVILGVCLLSTGLCLFVRGPSRIQPPQSLAGPLRFLGHHTLEIYVIQLAGSELIIKWFPGFAP